MLDPYTEKRRQGFRWSTPHSGVRQRAVTFATTAWPKTCSPYSPSHDFRCHVVANKSRPRPPQLLLLCICGLLAATPLRSPDLPGSHAERLNRWFLVQTPGGSPSGSFCFMISRMPTNPSSSEIWRTCGWALPRSPQKDGESFLSEGHAGARLSFLLCDAV